MSVNVQVVFYSMYGHVYRMAEAIAEGARRAEGADVRLFQVPELVPEDALAQSGAKEAREAFGHVPIVEPSQLSEADALVFGTPTRFGNMAAQMRNFFDRTGSQWFNGELIGKVASVFTSTGTQHGGQETTITSVHTTLLHHGMIVLGVPYSETRLTNMDEITGGTPYGASTLAGDGSRQPSENELEIARTQGERTARIAAQLKAGAHG